MSLKVYYVDDEPDLCESFGDYFTTHNVEVTTFIDPQLALEAIQSSPPDLLFLDYRLPGTTGEEIAKAIDPKFPVFLITGDISLVTEFKFSKVFYKPYRTKEIAETIQSFAQQKVS